MGAKLIPERVPAALREAIRDLLAETASDADLFPIAEKLWQGGFAEKTLRTLAWYGLRVLVGEENRHLRRKRDEPFSTTEAAVRARQPSPKWGGVRRVVRAHPEIFAQRIVIGYTAGGKAIWRFLGDCTARDLEVAEGLLRKKAMGLTCNADRLAALRANLRDRRQVVSGLPPERVEAIFNG